MAAAQSHLYEALADGQTRSGNEPQFYMTDVNKCANVLPDFTQHMSPDGSGPEPQKVVVATAETGWLQGGDDLFRLKALIGFLRRARIRTYQWNHRGDLYIELTDGDYLATLVWSSNEQ